MSRMSALSSVVLAAMALGAVACDAARKSPTHPKNQSITAMSSELVDREGRRILPGPRARVFAATAGALRVLGYSIAFVDQGSTVLKTEPMPTLTMAVVSGSARGFGEYRASSVSNAYARSYTVTFFDTAEGTLVRAAPRMFINGQDVSTGLVWELEGANGERANWERLFREIASNLGTAPAPPVPGQVQSSL